VDLGCTGDHDEEFPESLRAIAAQLSAARLVPTVQELDEIAAFARSRAVPAQRRARTSWFGALAHARAAVVASLAVVAMGGALALAGPAALAAITNPSSASGCQYVSYASGCVSPNWSGYVSRNPAPTTPVATRVTLPSIACNTAGSVSMWVGYDGWTTNTVEQDGVTGHCNGPGAKAQYYLWYELFKQSCFVSVCYGSLYNIYEQRIPITYSLAAGDAVDLFVARIPRGFPFRDQIFFSISAYSPQGKALGPSWTKTVTEPVLFNARYASAECVLETPGGGSGLSALPNFGTATFTNCTPIDDATSPANLLQVKLARNGRTLATTNPFVRNGNGQNSFTTSWNSSN
jgi:Peptidase A4 family